MASDSHLSVCPRVIVTCPNAGCKVKMIRAEIEDHQKTCSHQAISCKYNSLGCMFTVLRKDEHILRHHEADISGHLELVVMNPGSPSVTIKFSTNSGPQVSQPFYMHNYKLCIVFNMIQQEFKIYMLKGEYNDQVEWPIENMQAIMEVLNQEVNEAVAHKMIVETYINADHASGMKDPSSALSCALKSDFIDAYAFRMKIPDTPPFLDWFINDDQYYTNNEVYFRFTLKKLKATGWLSTNLDILDDTD